MTLSSNTNLKPNSKTTYNSVEETNTHLTTPLDQTNTNNDTTPSSSYPKLLLPFNKHKNKTDISANLNYLSPSVEYVYTKRDTSGVDNKLIGAEWDSSDVLMHNGRMLDKPMSLDSNGFQFVSSSGEKSVDIKNDILLNINFKNSNEVVDNYYPHCESLVHEAFYSEESKHKLFGVYAFDHNVRSSSNNIKSSSSSNTDKSIDDTNVLEPVGIVHNDYTIQSAPNRLKLLGQKPTSNNDVLYSKFQKNDMTSLVDPAVIEAYIF